MVENNGVAASNSAERAAGEFRRWLHSMREVLTTGRGIQVPCGTCRACCRSGYFIPVRAAEHSTMAVVPSRVLMPSLSASQTGDRLIAITPKGDCALFVRGNCSIYSNRPQACRDYDCRLFAATGLRTGHPAIDLQIDGWRFCHDDADSLRIQAAMQEVAGFILRYPQAFPGGRAPTRAPDVAVVAFKAHRIWLARDTPTVSRAQLAERIVQACRHFDAVGDWLDIPA